MDINHVTFASDNEIILKHTNVFLNQIYFSVIITTEFIAAFKSSADISILKTFVAKIFVGKNNKDSQ